MELPGLPVYRRAPLGTLHLGEAAVPSCEQRKGSLCGGPWAGCEQDQGQSGLGEAGTGGMKRNKGTTEMKISGKSKHPWEKQRDNCTGAQFLFLGQFREFGVSLMRIHLLLQNVVHNFFISAFSVQLG